MRNRASKVRPYTSKQMADACEMLVAAELTLAGVPALKVPDNWPGYDVIAQPVGRDPQRISVKARTYKAGSGVFVDYWVTDVFDWLAVCILPGGDQQDRQLFIIPRHIADVQARHDRLTSKNADQRYWRVDQFGKVFAAYRDNFTLNPTPELASV